MEKKALKKKERHRSTNVELLGGVGAAELRAMRELAQKADLPLEGVFRDVVAIGLSVIGDPEQSPYTTLIAFRTGLATKQMEFEYAHLGKLAPAETGRDFGERAQPNAGATVLDLSQSKLESPSEEKLEDRFDYALERSGQFTETETGPGLLEEG